MIEFYQKWREASIFLFYNDITSILNVLFTFILETFSNFMEDLLFLYHVFDMQLAILGS